MGITVYPAPVPKSPSLEIPAGNVPGKSSVNKFGNNGSLATSATETIWDGSNAYTFPTSASITDIRQATDQLDNRGASIEIQGLDTDWALVTQTVALDATNTTTEVDLTTALRRVFRMKVLDAEPLDADVWVGATGMSASTANGIIQTTNNQTLMAIYTIPAGKTGYMSSYWGTLNKDSGGGNPSVVVKMWEVDNTNGYAPQLKHIKGLDSGATSEFYHLFAPSRKILEKTDVYLNASNLSGTSTADVSAGFDIILVDN